MTSNVRVADSKGRITLPGWANATVIVECIGENEFRLRKAKVIPEDELRFSEEEMPIQLTDREAKKFLEVMKNPPKPTAVARKAARRFKAKYG